jgi:GNAT superfamily N-acetyltransferase
MPIKVIEIPSSRLAEYESIPISFEVRTIFELDLPDGGLGGIHFHERPVSPYFKDYDTLGPPASWLAEFDVTNWAFFLAQEGKLPVGAAAVAWNTGGVNMLEGRSDLAVLWDIRVSPAYRHKGVGKKLFEHSAAWSKARGCAQMKIETQNINVNACRFYAAMGARLGDIRRFAYRHELSVAHEVQLNWYLEL